MRPRERERAAETGREVRVRAGRGSGEWSGREARWRREENGAKKPSVLTISLHID